VREVTPGWQRRAPTLNGRRAECDELNRLVESIRSGHSRALVLHGEAGVGKTALLEYLAGHAPDCQTARAAGVQSEMELPFAALHQLCGPMLDQVAGLPAPQRDALRIVFGHSAEPTPDRFLIGLAVLGLLSAVAERRPLLCLVDDQQWLDRASALVLAFAARRLGAESIGLVFATRNPGGDLAGLPELPVAGLPDADARLLLDAALAGPIDGRIRDQIIAEARGNPLALLELPRELTPEGLAGGFGLPGALPLGIQPDVAYEETTLRMGVGDHFALYTDGLLEARDRSGELYSFARLQTLFSTIPNAAQATEAAVNFGQDDDITVLTLTRLATGEESTALHTAPMLAGA